MRKKREKRFLPILMCFCATLNLCAINMPTTEVRAEEMELVEPGYYDENIIPDKYNTGCDNSITLTPVTGTVTIDDVILKTAAGGTVLRMDFSETGAAVDAPSEIRFENYDFSPLVFSIISPGAIERTITFVNCKFGRFFGATSESESDRTENLIFINCEIGNFEGGNATFINCKFVGSDYSGLRLAYNITATGCYLAPARQIGVETSITPIDIYNKENIPAENFTFQNCRIEFPVVVDIDDKTTISPAIRISEGVPSVDNILFENCIINGGKYTFSFTQEQSATVSNITVRNTKVGSNYLLGMCNPDNVNSVTYDNVSETDNLIIGSVWKDDTGRIHLSVSNDTAEDKMLVVVTNSEVKTFEIKCLTTTIVEGATTTNELPFDIDITLDETDTDYIVCLDEGRQVRFVNWSDSPVYIEKELVNGSSNGGNDEIYTAEGTTDINVTMYVTQVNVTVPLNVNCVINPNAEEGFVCGDIIIQNNSLAPIKISLGDFTQKSGGFTMLTPEGIETVESGELTWDKLNSEQSSKYLSIGAGVGNTGWAKSLSEGYAYANNISEKFPLGVIAAKNSAALDLEAHYGYSFKSIKEVQLRMLFVAELNGELTPTPDTPDVPNYVIPEWQEGEDVYLLNMSYYQLWESGDYDEATGVKYEQKRRLIYPEYTGIRYSEYDVTLSENMNIAIYEYDAEKNYLGSTLFTNSDTFTPKEDAEYFTVALRHATAEKSMSYGQWKTYFNNGGVTIRISHGDTSIFEIDDNDVLCVTSGETTLGPALASTLLANNERALADSLWTNLVSSGAYQLTGKDLNNGNMTIYISSSEGDDENSGLSPLYPKKTLEQYSGMSNLNILLKCGDTFKVTESFLAGSNSVYAAYGEGPRPILNYYRQLPQTFEEVDSLDNLWVADISTLDICNGEASKSNCNIGQLLINDEVNWKRKVWSSSDVFDPNTLIAEANGSWAADWNTSKLYLYSETDPNNLDISYAPPLHAVAMNNVNDVVFKGIEIVGAGMHGISMKNADNIDITGCYIHHVGGSILLSAGIRYGNAIQIWDSGNNVLVKHNYADWIFDTCYTNQGSDATASESNITFAKNIGAHSFWGIETWGDGYTSEPFSDIDYSYNVMFHMMDITNPDTPMYSSKSGKVIFADPEMTKEQYVTYRGGYTYHQMSNVNVNNSGTGDPVKIHDNIFWNTNRFLALITNSRGEENFSCLYNNLFYGETDVAAPALFRYTNVDDEKTYLESPAEYIDDSNRYLVFDNGQTGDNTGELLELSNLMEIISGIR